MTNSPVQSSGELFSDMLDFGFPARSSRE